MSLIHKTVTPAAQAANRANSGESTGPRSGAGKDESKLNALKHGKFAARPDPATLMLARRSAAEEGERQALRAEIVRRYDPADDFATLQAEELADLMFEMRRLERVQQVLWEREQELLEVELRRRAVRQRPHVIEGLDADTRQTGISGAPDSPAKYREILMMYDGVRAYCGRRDFVQVKLGLRAIFGPDCAEHRARKMWNMVETGQHNQEPGAAECALGHLRTMIDDEVADARENLAICELEQGGLSPAGQVAHLLAATHSRAWSWVRQQENFLRRSIDRKVRCLIELRRQAARGNGARDPGAVPGIIRNGDSPGADGPRDSGLRAGATNPEGEAQVSLPAGEPGSQAPSPAAQAAASRPSCRAPKKNAPNRGTKPLCAVKSAERPGRRCAWALVQRAKSAARCLLRPARRAGTGRDVAPALPFWPRPALSAA